MAILSRALIAAATLAIVPLIVTGGSLLAWCTLILFGVIFVGLPLWLRRQAVELESAAGVERLDRTMPLRVVGREGAGRLAIPRDYQGASERESAMARAAGPRHGFPHARPGTG